MTSGQVWVQVKQTPMYLKNAVQIPWQRLEQAIFCFSAPYHSEKQRSHSFPALLLKILRHVQTTVTSLF